MYFLRLQAALEISKHCLSDQRLPDAARALAGHWGAQAFPAGQGRAAGA